GAGYDQGYRGRDADRYGGTDSLGNQECRLYLQDQFTSYGYTVTTQGIYDNVVAELTGSSRADEIYIIGAHYDTTTGVSRPGGDDNGSGTSAILELARVLSQYEFAATIRLIGFNTEEDGLKGSGDYVNNVVAAGGENVVGMVSMDMILRPQNDNDLGLPVDLDIGCPNSADDLAWVGRFVDASAEYVPELAIDPTTPFTSNWGSSDHQPFANAGYAAFLTIENSVDEIRGGSNSYYHRSDDFSDGAAGAAYDYGFATDVTQAIAATLAVEAEILPEPILLEVTADADVVYQNAPTTTGNRHALTLDLAILGDVNGNITYTTLVSQTSGAGAVEIIETADPMVWTIRGSRHGVGAVGPVTLTVFVGGDDFGGEASLDVPIVVRRLGDINGDSVVDTEDKLFLNRHLNSLDIPYPERLYDLDGDGVVDTQDKLVINSVLNGIPLP
ncbi:MAG: M28 family peptidase, partial [Anaerolineaceae bacterium]|nr:M28 family peptidase [Anaerolineaceae bacterium]